MMERPGLAEEKIIKDIRGLFRLKKHWKKEQLIQQLKIKKLFLDRKKKNKFQDRFLHKIK